MDTSTSLLERLRNSPDDESWTRLDALYRPLIRSWLKHDPSLGEEAEDLTQEILQVVCLEVAAFERQRTGSFRKWLRTITVHRLQGFYRARRSRPRPAGHEETSPLLQLADDRSDLARRCDEEHNAHVVGKLLEWLAEEFSPSHVQAFRRVVIDEVKPAVAAEELGVSVNAVLLARSRILQRLRQEGRGLLG
jgi:RNA polymerase sigma-70 factor (ECF subfamily)